MRVFFTADTHLGHERIIQYCRRPYGTVEEMDDALVRAWNAIVGSDDTVYHLGDLTLGGPEAAQRYFARLNGHLRVVPGGHDERWAKPNRTYQTQSGLVQLLPALTSTKLSGRHFVLCHYPLREWEGSDHGTFHLHGHAHGTLAPLAGSLDVGVDLWSAPIGAENVIARLAETLGDPTDGQGRPLLQ